jgi:hypothetical protein
MSEYSYEKCLERSYRVNWRIEDVVAGRDFDPEKSWLPRGLSGADGIPFLDAHERRQLTHIEMASYAHMFKYAEEFVAPMIVDIARTTGPDERVIFDALTNFAGEEVKHMNLFRRVRDHVNEKIGFEIDLLGRQRENVEYVLGKSRGAVLLLTACIEWFTQRHYQECFHGNENLDPFTRHIFKCHWAEESQHAQIDHLETVRAFSGMSDLQKDEAIDDLIELVGAVDGWLVEQAGFDTSNYERYTDRALAAPERECVFDEVLAAKRHTFLVSGVTHPKFLDLFAEVASPAQQDRVNEALVELLPVLGEEADAGNRNAA